MRIAIDNLLRWQPIIEAEAAAAGLPGSLVAAIISRETDAREKYCLPPQEGGALGDGGFGHGPMQIDKRSFPEWCAKWSKGQLSLREGVKQGCAVLKQKMRSVAVLIPEMPEELRLRAAIAAYNCGEGNVRRVFRAGHDIDSRTAHKTYSADVLARAEFLAKHGFSPIIPSSKETET